MKKLLFVIAGMAILLFTSCADRRKYITYESRDSLYSIGMPDSYTFQKDGNNMMVWEDNDNFIIVRENYAAGKTDFKIFVDRDVRNLPDKFTVNLQDDSNDSVRHYTVHTNTFYQEDTYFYIDGENANYIIEVRGEGMETARKIASSFVEIDKATTKKTDDKTIYKKEGFAIGKEYALEVFNEYVNQMKQVVAPDKPKLIGAYYYLKDKESPQTATLFNINVFDISNQPKEGRIESYIGLLNEAGIENKRMKFEHCDGVVYSYTQDMDGADIPSKALYVIRGNKYYLFQVTTNNDVDLQFDKLLKSIIFIK